MEKPDYVYILYPVKTDALLKSDIFPVLSEPDFSPAVPIQENDTFVPLWYGNACFPEDED